MRRMRKRFNGKPYGMYGLIFILAITGGIARDKNVKADILHSNGTIVTTTSIYSSKDKTVNIIPNGVDAGTVKSPPIKKVKPNYKLNMSKENSDLIYELCLKNNLSYEFVLSVFHYESKFDPNARNKNTDISEDQGFAQINSYYTDTYKGYAIQYCGLSPNVQFDPFNSDHGIRAGIGTLTYLKNYWVQEEGVGNESLMNLVVGSYNLGLQGMKQYIKKTGITEREYSRQIQIRKDKLRSSNSL